MTVRIVVELAISDVDPQGWDLGQWDTAPWQAAYQWHDVSCDCQGFTYSAGRSGPLDRYRSATGTLQLDNRSGVYDAWSELTPWAPPGVRHLGAGTRIRVGVEVDDDPVSWQFTGKADAWHGRNGYVEIPVVDDLADLSLANLPEQAAQGAGELAGARIARILAEHLYTGPVALDAGVVPLQATTLAADALSLLYLTVDSDGGWLFVDGDGTLCFLDANREQEDPRWKAPTLVVADDGTGDVCPVIAPDLDDDRDAVRNLADIAAAGGTAHIAVDDASTRRYGIRTMQRHDLIHTDEAWSQTLADRIVARAGPGGTRVAAVEVWPTETSRAARTVAATRLHDRIRVVWHGAGDVFAVDSYLDAWTYDLVPLGVDREVIWRAALNLSPVAEFVPAGRWDTAVWDTDVWGIG